MIDAQEISNILDSIKSSLQAAKLQKDFNHILKDAFKDYKVFCRTLRSKKAGFDYFIGAMYDTCNDRIYIQITLSDQVRVIDVNYKIDWREFKFLFSQTLQHELIHRSQAVGRDNEGLFDTTENRIPMYDTIEERQEYLNDRDEIDAYGHDIALEILYYYRNKNPYDVLRRIERTKKVWSYNYYKTAYETNPKAWNVIKKRLLKKAYQWLPHAKVHF